METAGGAHFSGLGFQRLRLRATGAKWLLCVPIFVSVSITSLCGRFDCANIFIYICIYTIIYACTLLHLRTGSFVIYAARQQKIVWSTIVYFQAVQVLSFPFLSFSFFFFFRVNITQPTSCEWPKPTTYSSSVDGGTLRYHRTRSQSAVRLTLSDGNKK